MYQFPTINNGIVLHLRARLASWAAVSDHRADYLGAYNARVSEVTRVLMCLLDALSIEAKERAEKSKAQLDNINADVLRAFQDLTYRLAEMYDFFWRLPDGLDIQAANRSVVGEYKSVLRGARRTACLICNKIKHNNHQLGRADNFYDAGFYVEGFVLLSRGRKATFQVSRELHEAEKSGMSFNLEVRSLIFDALRADVAAGRLCSALGAGEIAIPDITLLNALKLLSGRPEIGLRFERARSIYAMWEESGNWMLGVKSRDLPILGKKVHVIQSMSGDGYTKTFPLAG